MAALCKRAGAGQGGREIETASLQVHFAQSLVNVKDTVFFPRQKIQHCAAIG